jgi:signal transduction histidine kinase
LASNGIYDVEYRTIGVEDQLLRWVRAKGQVYFDENDRPLRFIGSVLDITEQKHNEQRKNDFISMVSHELKTPLTSMKSYIQVLHNKAQKRGDELSSGMLEKANKQAGRMATLINGFLNVSRLESGQIHIDRRRFDMAELSNETKEETLAQVTSHRVVFAPVETTMVNADRDKIGQVLNNLISNAVKYSPQGSTINVACVTQGNNALVSVKDEGMGISQEDIPKLFERYYRVKSSGYQHVSGFGIGLYICCEIIKRHEGDIWAESEPGKGSTFYFTLPVIS